MIDVAVKTRATSTKSTLPKGNCFFLAQVGGPSAAASFHHPPCSHVWDPDSEGLGYKPARLGGGGGSGVKKERLLCTHVCTQTWDSQPVVDGRSHHRQPEPVGPWLGPAARADNAAQLFVFPLPRQASKA